MITCDRYIFRSDNRKQGNIVNEFACWKFIVHTYMRGKSISIVSVFIFLTQTWVLCDTNLLFVVADRQIGGTHDNFHKKYIGLKRSCLIYD